MHERTLIVYPDPRLTPLGDERVEQCGAGRAVVAFVAVGGHEPFVAPPDMHA